MTPDKLLALIAEGEGETLEFKRSIAELEKAVETVAAFANTRGGVVMIGVRPDGWIDGVDVGQTTRERIANRITGNTDPVVYPAVEFMTVEGRTVAVITVPESADKPHLAFGRAFKRVGAVTAQMDRNEYERLLLARRQLPFDSRELVEATLDDLDEAKLRWYVQLAAQERGIPADLTAPLAANLKRLGVAAEREGRLALTTAALLLFGKRPQQFLPYTMVRVARFQGTTTLNFIDRLDCFGTLPEMIDEAERFIKRNTRIAAKITGFERREITEYPYPAVREAIANAVAHRDYDRSDKVTFTGPGENILDLIPEEGVTDLRALGLNERQVDALRLMVNEGRKLTNRQYRQLFDITDRTALRDLETLMAVGYVQRTGEGRTASYTAI